MIVCYLIWGTKAMSLLGLIIGTHPNVWMKDWIEALQFHNGWIYFRKVEFQHVVFALFDHMGLFFNTEAVI